MSRTAKDIAQGLREMADVIEGMPDEIANRLYTTVRLYEYDAEKYRSFARHLGTFEKGDDETNYEITRVFSGDVRMFGSISRGKICRKVIVKKEVEVEEYVCDDSLLDPLANVEA